MKTSFVAAFLACAVLSLARSASAANPSLTAAPPTDVILFPHGQVDHVFTTGGALQINKSYKVQAGRRVAPGLVEVHTFDTDVFYIVDGTATFVTGGTAVNPRETGPGEIKADSITGGTERTLSKGDVIIIPKGTPHQFTAVPGPFLYFVVKVTE